MRDERERFRKFPVFQPSRSRVQFYTMKCMSQRDSKGATLSKAAQDQSEDKPLPVALMLAQVRCAEGVSKTSLDSIHPGTNNGPLAKTGGGEHPPACTRKSCSNNSRTLQSNPQNVFASPVWSRSSWDDLNKPQIPVHTSHPQNCLTTPLKANWQWSKGVTEPEHKGLVFKQVL